MVQKRVRGVGLTGWNISYISYSIAVLFEEGYLALATQSCPTSFSVCNTQPPAEIIQLKNSPERVGTSCWIHLNKDCQQKKHVLNHSFDLANPWSVTQFHLLYHRRSVIPSVITELFSSFCMSSYKYPFRHVYRDFQIYTGVCKGEWKCDSI